MIKLSAFADEYGSTLEDQIEGLNKNGIEYIEIRSVNGKNIADVSDEEAKNIYDQLSLHGIKVWSIGSPIGKVDINCDFVKYKQKVERVCDIAKILKADKIRMFSFFNAYNSPELVFDYLQQIVDIGNNKGIKMFHENEKEVFGDTVDRILQIQENVKGLNYIYDPANFVQCDQDADYAMEKLFDSIGYFHIKDVIHKTGQLVPAGYGDGKIEKLLNKMDFDAVLTMEPHLVEFDGYKGIDNTQMLHKFHFDNGKDAFCFAVKSLKEILFKLGYKENNNCFEK